jgi:tetratricopeptide (TPR) repeat protein
MINEPRDAAGTGRASEVIEGVVAADGGLPPHQGTNGPPGAPAPGTNGTAVNSGTDTAHPPADIDALHHRATNLARQGRFEESLPLYREVVQLKPDHAEAHNNLGIALGRMGRFDEAAAAHRDALRCRPDYPEAFNNLGIALARQGNAEEALPSFDEALRLRVDYPEAHNNRGNALRALGKTDEALECYRQALVHRPSYPEAHNNLGNALADKDQLDEAAACYREALKYNPSYPEAHNNLGNTLARLKRIDEAVRCYHRALQQNPDYAEAYNNLANTLADEGRLAEAVACYREAMRLNPTYAEAYNNLGITLGKQRKYGDAGDCYREALRLKPDYPDAHLNRALCWLQAGQWEQGWPEYEWRWRCRGVSRPNFTQPAWGGEPLAGRTIFVYSEQGLGDTFQFIRYAPLIKRRGGIVMFECQPQLVPLISRCPGLDRLVPKGTPVPDFQAHSALLSLPWALRTTLSTVIADVPYLYADPALVTYWREELAHLRGYRIGINWQGNPEYKGDRHRSIPLERFAPLADLPEVQLLSLQKGLGAEQLAACGERMRIVELGSRLDEKAGAFMDTAAVLMNLDLFVTSDTAVAHLAGALGVPTWLALPWSADWRWLEIRADSPWYPTMRLFRQSEPGDWETVFRRMADDLAPMLDAPKRGRPVVVEVAAGELIDKLTILEIKAARIHDQEKLRNVLNELAAVHAAYARSVEPSPQLNALSTELKAVNTQLWDTEDEIRRCEQTGEFGAQFVELARRVYTQNDQRAELKRQINQLLGSHHVEEKSYAMG